MEEELEPLFDYSRVQPADLCLNDIDEDSDSSPCFSDVKKRKCCSSTENGGSKFVLVEEEEEDWLPPPPQEIIDSSLDLVEDETIRALRLKKEELASFARSTEDVMKAVIESAKKDLKNSSRSDDEDQEKTVKPNIDRPKILISIQGKDGQKQFRMFKDDKFERLFKMYAGWAKVDLENLVFCFDGDKVNAASTPENLCLEDDDIIEVHVKRSN